MFPVQDHLLFASRFLMRDNYLLVTIAVSPELLQLLQPLRELTVLICTLCAFLNVSGSIFRERGRNVLIQLRHFFAVSDCFVECHERDQSVPYLSRISLKSSMSWSTML